MFFSFSCLHDTNNCFRCGYFRVVVVVVVFVVVVVVVVVVVLVLLRSVNRNTRAIQCPVSSEHFTVVCSVAWPLNGSEGGGDLVLI